MVLWKILRAIKRRRDTLDLSLEARQARNLTRFRQLAAFVNENSPWYRRIIKDNFINPAECYPSDFPVLTSALLEQNFDEIVTDPNIKMSDLRAFIANPMNQEKLYLGRYHIVLSSGSSGIPRAFVHTSDEVINGMSYGALHRKIKPRTRTSFIGPLDTHDMGAAVMGLMKRWPQRLLYNSRDFNIAEPWTQIIDGLNDHQPRIVTAYKHYLMALADEARAGRLKIKPTLLESGGEPLFPHERQILRSTFQCEIANSYGSSEVNIMGVSLNDWGGLYLFEDDLLFEPEIEGTNVTNLFNRTMPLIRYRFDDILDPVEPQDPKMPFRCVSESIGRSQELITFDTGSGAKRKMRTIFFDEGVDMSGVKRIQFKKKDMDTLIVSVAFVEEAELKMLGCDESKKERLRQLTVDIRQHLDDNMLGGVKLETCETDTNNAEDRIVRNGRKEKLVVI